jgi:membrane-bound lytic murein transglycosylase B
VRRVEALAVGIPVILIGGLVAGVWASSPAPAAAPSSAERTTSTAPRSAPSASPTPTGTPGPQADAAWLDVTAAATRIPRRALQGYASAALREAREDPGCHVSWSTLAALGAVESNHGTLDGTEIDAGGHPVGLIVGPVLDGRTYTAVADTDGGRWDGISDWDRAVGPMQILPAMWAVVGADDSGDGVADPNQIDDAAYGAARLLCSSSRDLATSEGWDAAIGSYNPATTYRDEVARRATAYAAAAPAG